MTKVTDLSTPEAVEKYINEITQDVDITTYVLNSEDHPLASCILPVDDGYRLYFTTGFKQHLGFDFAFADTQKISDLTLNKTIVLCIRYALQYVETLKKK